MLYECFLYAHFYIARSRVSSTKNLVLSKSKILAPCGRTTNVVYKEVLQYSYTFIA